MNKSQIKSMPGALDTSVAIWMLKLSNTRPGQCIGGRPLGSSWCCRLGILMLIWGKWPELNPHTHSTPSCWMNSCRVQKQTQHNHFGQKLRHGPKVCMKILRTVKIEFRCFRGRKKEHVGRVGWSSDSFRFSLKKMNSKAPKQLEN